jgi:putative ABC transport system permease protein
MREAVLQALVNLRANRLRSLLTMFGVMWGMISIVVLSATGEGFRLGNEAVLRELGRNIAILRGGRTSREAGGERAGRRITLTVADARALAEESAMAAVVSPELVRLNTPVKSAYNRALVHVTGVEPPYQNIRTIELESGRPLSWSDETLVSRVAVVGFDIAEQLFGARPAVGETLTIEGRPYLVVGQIRDKRQDSSYDGPDNNKIFVPFATMLRDMPRRDALDPAAISDIIVAPHQVFVDRLPGVLERRSGRLEDIEWPLERNLRAVLARRHDFDPEDADAISIWDTALESLLFGRMIDRMRRFFSFVGLVTLALGGIGVMNIMLVAVRERTSEIGLRKAMGATRRAIERQFFLEGFVLTLASGGVGMLVAVALCQLVNLAEMPARFAGMIVSRATILPGLAVLVLVGVLTSTYPARRAAALPPVEALRFEA